MEEFILDHEIPVVDQEVKFAGFWLRFWAVLIDGLVVSVVPWFLPYFLNTFLISLTITLLTLCYQPWLEFRYGATLGKMALGLKVVNRNFQRPKLKDVLIRDIFWLILGLVTIMQSYFKLATYDFDYVGGYSEYSSIINDQLSRNLVVYIYALVALVDGIVMISDNKSQALHDKIAKTYVIKQG